MKKFLDENFLLNNKTAEQLYHEFVKQMPVIDYHNHLPPQQIADDHCFENLTQAWLYGDHYKWRAMRTNGVDEGYCTGYKSDYEKFEQWSATVPYTLRNPLYHWTHLELQRYFDVHEILSPSTAFEIYSEGSKKLQSKEYSVRNLLRKMKVEFLCTTDDPTDSLEHHRKIQDDGFEIKVLPTFRPDKAMQVESEESFNAYLKKLENACGFSISNYESFLNALQNRHDYFATMGCIIADHGLAQMYAENYAYQEIENIFLKIRGGKSLQSDEQLKFKSAVLADMVKMNYATGWVQRFHLGAKRNNNTRMMLELGPDTGWDSIGDSISGATLSKFLDMLDADNMLAEPILYNLNPADNELMAPMAGNFNYGSVVGQDHGGSDWWLFVQEDRMVKQVYALSTLGL